MLSRVADGMPGRHEGRTAEDVRATFAPPSQMWTYILAAEPPASVSRSEGNERREPGSGVEKERGRETKRDGQSRRIP